MNAHCISKLAGSDVAKSWMFASSALLLTCLAGNCGSILTDPMPPLQRFLTPWLLCQCMLKLAILATSLHSPAFTFLRSGRYRWQAQGRAAYSHSGRWRKASRLHAQPSLQASCMVQAKIPSRLHALLQGQEIEGLLSVEEIAHTRLLGHSGQVSWDIPAGQPYASARMTPMRNSVLPLSRTERVSRASVLQRVVPVPRTPLPQHHRNSVFPRSFAPERQLRVEDFRNRCKNDLKIM